MNIYVKTEDMMAAVAMWLCEYAPIISPKPIPYTVLSDLTDNMVNVPLVDAVEIKDLEELARTHQGEPIGTAFSMVATYLKDHEVHQ